MYSLASMFPDIKLTFQQALPFSVLHFLEFAIWGAWWTVLGNYLEALGFSRKHIGRVYATMPLGAVISPMFLGSIADRYFPTEQLIAVCHIVGAVLLFAMAAISRPRLFYAVTLLYALVYSPTLSLVNSIVFAHIPQAEDFPFIRVWGTIGWILAGLSLMLLLPAGKPVNNRPLILAGFLSLILGVFCFYLPHTPPPAAGAEAEIPFFRALALFKDPAFGVFFGVSLFIALALAFYFSFTGLFLERAMGVKPENVGPLMTIGQCVEIGFMFTLPLFLKTIGMNWVLAIGMAAWGLRYAIFATRGPLPFVLIGVALHGICFDFFFAAGFIHMDRSAPADIRNSAQSLFGVLTYGLGMWLGTEASGWLNQWFTKETIDLTTGQTIKTTNWTAFWLVPCVGVLIALAVFVAYFFVIKS